MDQTTYQAFERYMLHCADSSAHDDNHIYRVLYAALDIAEHEQDVNMDILIAACLLHDVGRSRQQQDPSLCHAAEGAKMAYAFCLEQGMQEEDARHIRDCVASHRFSKDIPPATIEAKILFDADKLDAAGLTGIARTLVSRGEFTEPLYVTDKDGKVLDGTHGGASFFQEYHRKLENIYKTFLTERGRALADAHRQSAVAFYEGLLEEVSILHDRGPGRLEVLLQSPAEE